MNPLYGMLLVFLPSIHRAVRTGPIASCEELMFYSFFAGSCKVDVDYSSRQEMFILQPTKRDLFHIVQQKVCSATLSAYLYCCSIKEHPSLWNHFLL